MLVSQGPVGTTFPFSSAGPDSSQLQCNSRNQTMSTFHDPARADHPYKDPTPLPASVPKVQELGVTSAPLKSAAFFIGAYCKEYNEDFMLCKNESGGDPGACLKEGRRVTRCATDLINKMRESCLEQFETHWNCLELNNQPSSSTS